MTPGNGNGPRQEPSPKRYTFTCRKGSTVGGGQMSALDLRREVSRLRGALVRVAELLEDGAPGEAYAFAVAAAEAPAVRWYACPLCTNAYEWPGALADHLSFAHSQEPSELARWEWAA